MIQLGLAPAAISVFEVVKAAANTSIWHFSLAEETYTMYGDQKKPVEWHSPGG